MRRTGSIDELAEYDGRPVVIDTSIRSAIRSPTSIQSSSFEQMEIALRKTVDADLPDIFRIRVDPLVLPNQYKLTKHDTLDAWKRQLFGDYEGSGVQHKCTTIIRQAKIIGHISHVHFDVQDRKMCYCGWNLAPEYWGQGIAVIALTQFFDALFCDRPNEAVISDCFSRNQRCIRVIQKLGYQPIQIALYERMKIAFLNRCLHWIRRYLLTAEQWHDQREGAAENQGIHTPPVVGSLFQ